MSSTRRSKKVFDLCPPDISAMPGDNGANQADIGQRSRNGGSALPVGLSEAADLFIRSKVASGCSPSYKDTLEFTCGLFIGWCVEMESPGAHQVTPELCEEYLVFLRQRPKWFGERRSGKPISTSYIETNHRRLKGWFGWLVKRGYIKSNPWVLVDRPKVEQKVIPTISLEERRTLLAAVDPRRYRGPSDVFRALRDTAALSILIESPARKSEITGLQIEDVDLKSQTLRVQGKGAKWRHVLIHSNRTIRALEDYLEAREGIRPWTDDLWMDQRGRPMTGDWLSLMLRRLSEITGIKAHCHMFRHTFAAEAVRAGVQLSELEQLGGWTRGSSALRQTYLATIGEEDARRALARFDPMGQVLKSGMRKGKLQSAWRRS